MAGAFWGGLMKGAAQGLQAAEERQLKKQMLKLQQQKLKLEEDEALFKTNQFKRQIMDMDRQDRAIEEFGRLQGGERPQQIETEAADPIVGAQAREAEPRDLRSAMIGMVPRNQMASFLPHLMKQESDKGQVVGAGGALVDPRTGKVMFENKSGGGRSPMDIVNRTYFELRNSGQDHESALAEAVAAAKSLTGGRSAAGTQAKIDVQTNPANMAKEAERKTTMAAAQTAGEPVAAGTGRELSQLEALMGTVGKIRSGFNREYIGPIKGTDIAFEARRRIGSSMGAPLSGGEVDFRQSLKDATDQLLRARSGAAINEGEYARLVAMLPKATDEENVFLAGLDRYETELKRTMAAKMKMAVTPRKDLPGGAPATGKAPRILSITPMPGQ